MSYFTQKIVASHVYSNGLKVIIREGLNNHENLELRLEVPCDIRPEFEVDYGKLVYERRGHFYFAEDQRTGIVSFFYYAHPGNGFGGATYTLNVNDGTVEELHGPWSSSASDMNREGFKPCKEVYICIGQCAASASAMTAERINELIAPMGYVCERRPNTSRYFIVKA